MSSLRGIARKTSEVDLAIAGLPEAGEKCVKSRKKGKKENLVRCIQVGHFDSQKSYVAVVVSSGNRGYSTKKNLTV